MKEVFKIKSRFLAIVLAFIVLFGNNIIAASEVYASLDEGELVVTGYRLTDAKGNPVGRLTKGSVVNIDINLRHTKLKASDIGASTDNIHVSRKVDSFGGGDIQEISLNPDGLLDMNIKIANLSYKGSGSSLKLMVGYNGESGAQNQIEIPITECKEYEEPQVEPVVPKEPDPLPPPKAIISRNDILTPISQDEEMMVTIYIKNVSSVSMESPIVQLTSSEGLMLNGNTTMFQLNTIKAGKTESLQVPIKAASQITDSTQSLNINLSFNYHNRLRLTEATIEGKVLIPAKVKKQKEEEMAGPVPNLIIKKYTYGGGPVAAGTDFQLKFDVENTSTNHPIENLIVGISTGEGLTLNGSTNTFYFRKIYEGEEKTIKVPLSVGRTVISDSLPVTASFKFEYVENGKRNQVNSEQIITIPTYQQDRFEISKPELPVTAYAGEELSIMLNYANKSKTDIFNVEANIVGDIDSVTNYQNIGNLTPGKSGTIAFVVTPLDESQSNFEIVINYEDGNGDIKERCFPINLNIEEVEYDDFEDIEEPALEEPKSNKKMLIGCGIGALILAATFITIIKRKKKKKDSLALEYEDIDNDL